MKKATSRKKARRFSLVLVFCFTAITFMFAGPRPVGACPMVPNAMDDCLAKKLIQEFHDLYERHIMENISNQFKEYRDWLVETFFKNEVLPALMEFTQQMEAVGMYQVFIFGTFLDAKQQLETQRLFQQLQYEAQRDYQPSDDFCWFGTNVRSLGATEELGKLNALTLGERQLKRQLGNSGLAGAQTRDYEKSSRWKQFVDNYCDPNDNNRITNPNTPGTGLQLICQGGPRVNNDIDYTRMIEEPRTLNVAFDDAGGSTPAEQDIFAMASNLYGHDVLTRQADDNYLSQGQYQHLYLALRSVAAKRSVAQNSFDAIVGLKSAGTDTTAGASKTRDFLGAVMTELGVPPEDVYKIIGEQPSYYAQLEILAKKIYQNPDFFAGLYDSPANIERKSVALKAIELMLDRAIYESQIRQEMATSVLLSARLRPQFRRINNQLSSESGSNR